LAKKIILNLTLGKNPANDHSIPMLLGYAKAKQLYGNKLTAGEHG